MQTKEASASNTKKQPPTQKAQIKDYDFGQPKLVSKEIMQALYRNHNLFSREVERIFSNVFNSKVEVVLEDIEQVIFVKFLNSVKSPSALFVFDIDELDDWAVLQLPPAFCAFLVEHESGGRSMELGEPRSLTHLEERIMGRTIDKIFSALSHMWSSYFHTDMTISNYVYESDPANIRIISAHIPAIKVSFKLKVENLEIPFKISYPYALLKAYMTNSADKFNNNEDKETLSNEQQQQFKNEMKQVDVFAKARLGTATLPIRKLLDYEEGDLIRLDQHIEEPLDVLVNDKLKMLGFPGTKNGKKAVKILKPLNDKN